jgi:hypothetical protein
MIIIIRIWIRILSRRDSSLLELLDIAIVEEGKLVNNNAAVVAPPGISFHTFGIQYSYSVLYTKGYGHTSSCLFSNADDVSE